jgi:hypothetical protein
MKSSKSSRSRNSVDPSNLCQFSFSDGRQCRMLRHESHSSLCLIHAREERQLLDLEEIGDELASISGEFRTTTDINHVIGKLFKLVATGRIPARRAENLTYLAQLLLYSQKHIRYETNLAEGSRAWVATLRTAYPAPESEDELEEETDETGPETEEETPAAEETITAQ